MRQRGHLSRHAKNIAVNRATMNGALNSSGPGIGTTPRRASITQGNMATNATAATPAKTLHNRARLRMCSSIVMAYDRAVSKLTPQYGQ